MRDKPYIQIGVHMQKSDYEQFLIGYNRTIYRSRNEYARKLLLGKPVTIVHRNRSLDDFIETAVKLKKDLRLLLSKNSFTTTEKEILGKQLTSIENNLIEIVHRCGRK